MATYTFDEKFAKTVSLENLFKLVLVLVEVQRKANMFRAGLPVTDLNPAGICSNIDRVCWVYVDWYRLFFEDEAYPIQPYHHNESIGIEAFWGNNPVGDSRMEVLALMIKDLTEYLTNEA